jgi:alpha-tubulin suppressor-like RCC1 family protein
VVADTVIVSKGLHTCVRAVSGEVSCFGGNAVGQLGVGSSSLTPELLPLSTGIVDAVSGSGGTFHSCVRRANGKVACWGINSAGQLGDGKSGTLSMNPVLVVGLP